MRVGVIIPVHNRPGLVLEALDSVLAQSEPPESVVVVDDGSTDLTPDAVDAWFAAHGRAGWGLVRATHAGAAEARQRGFEECLGRVELVAFLDSDDRWPGDFLARARACLSSDPSLAGASADRLVLDGSTGREHLDDLRTMPAHPLRWLVLHDAGIGSASMVRAEALCRIGGYPTGEPTGHDIGLFAGLFAVGGWAHLPGPPVVFRRHHAPSRGEADHIYRRVSDANLRHARLYERAARGLTERERRSFPIRRKMAARWIAAAKECRRRKDTTGAVACLEQAVQYQRFSLRAARLKRQIRQGTPRYGPAMQR